MFNLLMLKVKPRAIFCIFTGHPMLSTHVLWRFYFPVSAVQCLQPAFILLSRSRKLLAVRIWAEV